MTSDHHDHRRGLAALLPARRHDDHGTGAARRGARPCCDVGGHRVREGGMPRIVFIGNPNVGKSSLFNAILGARARVMNAPGTTVLLEEGVYDHDGERWDLIDTPGTYSLLPLSPDEEVAAQAVMGLGGDGDPDLVVTVVDATNISRALYFLATVLELGRPTVVALTMNDLAARQGARVDPAQLSRALDGVPVVEVDGRTGAGAAALMDAVGAHLSGTPMPHGLTKVQVGDVDARDWVEGGADARFDWAADVLSRLDMRARDRVTVSDRIDRVLLNPVLGVVAFLLLMLGVFEATTTLAGPAQDWIDGTVRDWLVAGADWLFARFGPAASGSWVHSLVVDGVIDGVVAVATFIPPMGIMFILLSLLEDSGYLARAAFVMDRAMRCMGLDGRAFLPIVIGFGCNLPALAATRTLPDSRQRVLVGMLVPFSSCTARLSVYLVLAYAFFRDRAGLVVFLMYVCSIVLILLVGVLLRRVRFTDVRSEPFAMSLPPYQVPRLITLGRSVLMRLWGFVRGASTIIVSMLVVMWLLQSIPATAAAGSFAKVDDVHDSLYGVVADHVAPVFAPAGFDDWHASAALMTGFVAKEVVVASMAQSYSIDTGDEDEQQQGEGSLGAAMRASFDESSGGHGRAAAIAFMLFTLAYTPCLATVAELRRQYSTRIAMQSVGLGLVVAYLLAVVAFQTLRWLL
ncbi:ferrous iron transport protein B [Bifidobacterium choerinum]|uniref:Ferrous iron transport protein B n=1 Tax=Bifidobacterium choerinum TaxID=35760 RepID=A0A2D3D713_9BIFI|nr:ferrous iron transport protein B [Bifidobacterium choerinum]ATU20895.1 ferrous iron transport protein B [Bifidobacterium choerinum]